MTCSRRKFVKGIGTVVIFAGPLSGALANTSAGPGAKPFRYAMIHDESLCNGCNLCTIGCRNVNRVPPEGARLSIAHIPTAETRTEIKYRFFRQSCQHCEHAPCIDVCPTGASYRDPQNGIVRINTSKCIGCSYCISACPYQVRYLNKTTRVADKCDFCLETRLLKGYPPICVSVCPQKALIFGREDSPEIQNWLNTHDYYLYQLEGAGKPQLYRHFGEHVVSKENV